MTAGIVLDGDTDRGTDGVRWGQMGSDGVRWGQVPPSLFGAKFAFFLQNQQMGSGTSVPLSVFFGKKAMII